MSDTEKLLLCPFCGGTADNIFDHDGTKQADGKKWA